ncbi:hypothetical protein DOM22_02755 [Bdellovibrio sp. ZAP7]|uniref:hypothetical protein n=1 Tax=Bdellovibrio sp. ZAP7 TaxID=2231053 RepID=UPI0011589232|nr:hypothetical protein [Bdellovibrio sp. ZAP7]QDK44147.1 hypothetical protein DOM22_02755 [Bdellovibrio sp. ZAP7]
MDSAAVTTIQFEEAFQKRDLEKLAYLLSQASATTGVSRAEVAYYQAKLSLIKGDLKKSFSELKNIVHNFGATLPVLSDLTAVSFLAHDVLAFGEYSQKLELEFIKNRNSLDTDVLLRTLIFIGKIKELQADVCSALNYFNDASVLGAGGPFQEKALAQIVRLSSFMGTNNGESAKIYNVLSSGLRVGTESDFDVIHALIILEIRLLGVEIVEKRILNLIESNLSPVDLRQLVCHFLEEAMILEKSPSTKLLQCLSSKLQFSQINAYENAVFSQFFNIGKVEVVPVAGTLDELKRIIYEIQDAPQGPLQTQLRKQFLFKASSLPQDSQKVLLDKWSQCLKSSISESISVIHGDVMIGSNRYAGKNAKLLLDILTQFLKEKTDQLASEKVVANLFGDLNYDDSQYHRLRMAVSRLNKELQQHHGLIQTFKVRYTTLEIQVSLNKSV